MSIINRLGLLPADCRSMLYRAIAWMTTAAILDGVTGLVLLGVIEAWFANDPAVLRWALVLVGLTLVQSIVLYRALRLGFTGGSSLAAGLVARLVEHLPKLNPFALARLASPSGLLRGQVMHSMAIPAHLLGPLVTALVTPAVIVAGLLFLDPRAALGLLVAGSCLGFALRWSSARTLAAESAHLAAEQDVVRQVQDFAEHQALLRSAGRAGATHQRLQGAIEALRARSRALLRRTLPGSLLFGLLVQASFAAMLVAGAWMIEHGLMNGIRLVAMLILLIRFMEPLTQLVHLDQALRTALQAFDTLLRILELPALPSPAVGRIPEDASLEARALAFGPDDGRVLLSALECRIDPGSLTAIVGSSGAGKSTLLGLLARLYDPTEGAVVLGQVDLRDVAETTLAASRNLVSQDNGLFRGTAAWNLRMAKPGASLDELRAAAGDAALLTEIEHWPEQWDRDIGPSGSLLSGGQRQRLCLARGFLAPAPVLLLDEPTASLDAFSEDQVLRSLAALRGSRTVVAVTHNPSFARLADQILVLDRGRLRAAGTHADLCAQDSWYARFAGTWESAEQVRSG